jgi:hypothetical protein
MDGKATCRQKEDGEEGERRKRRSKRCSDGVEGFCSEERVCYDGSRWVSFISVDAVKSFSIS